MKAEDVGMLLERWRRQGVWSARKQEIAEWLGLLPLATTRQLADGLFGQRQESARVTVRKEMRELLALGVASVIGVVERDRLAVGRGGRPENVYRVTGAWAEAMGYAPTPLSDDRGRSWLQAEIMIAARQRGADFRAGTGRLAEDWVASHEEPDTGNHMHQYLYAVSTEHDAQRLAEAMNRARRAYMDRGPRKWSCRWSATPCTVVLIGFDINLSLGDGGVSPWNDWIVRQAGPWPPSLTYREYGVCVLSYQDGA